MPDFFRPYEGKKPFFFVSYSHSNTAFVLETLSLLREKSYLLWYDEGIPAGSDWPKNISEHMERCHSVVFFRSEYSLASRNCLSEISTAKDKGKTVISIPLDSADPPEDQAAEWADALQSAAVYPLFSDPKELADTLTADPKLFEHFRGSEDDYIIRRSSVTRRRIADLILLLLALGVLFGGAALYAQRELSARVVPALALTEYSPTPAPAPDIGQYAELFKRPVEFPDRQTESAVRRALSLPDGNISADKLTDITELFFCGDKNAVSAEDISRSGDGEWSLYGQAVAEGSITDLLFFRQLPYLDTLELVYQPIRSLSTSSESDSPDAVQMLPSLRVLSLAGCSELTLDGIGAMPSLETLELQHSGVRDLTPLSALPSLRTVTVSIDMLPLKLERNAGYDVILVK